jgi:hypothetical protein
MSNNVTQILEQTIFGELSTAEVTPIVQISAQYALEEGLNIITSDAGSYVIEDSLYKVTSGTNPLGLSSLNTKRQATYRPGQGMIARGTAIFDNPVADTLQAFGFITSEDSFGFGYLGESFGVLRATGGIVEAQELTITTPAGGAENATVTINGAGYTVPLTAGTVEHNAWEIAQSLSSQVANFLFSSNEDTVYCMAQVPGPNGAYAFTSATAVAAFVQQAAGVDPTITVIEQSNWNVDTFSQLNPQTGNIYEIKFGYLGFSGIEFYVKNPENNEKTLVHILEYGNSETSPIVRNPTFRIGWIARNLGSTTGVTIQGASAMGAIEGKIIVGDSPRGLEAIQLSVGSVQTNVLAVRNRFHAGDIINRATIKPLLLSFATSSNREAFFEITVNPTFGGDLDFSYVDKDNSIIEVATDAVTVSGGRFVAAFTVTSQGLVLSSSNFETRIEPDQIFSISAAVTSGAASDMVAAVSLLEDL